MLALYKLTAKQQIMLIIVLLALSLVGWPVSMMTIHEKTASDIENASSNSFVFKAYAPLGQKFWTHYIHSVQRTPVLDRYHLVNGQIWSWQEYIQSHNAGLPFEKPRWGRFWMRSPWMIVEGGRQHWKSIILRVGNAELGQNTFAYQYEMPQSTHSWLPLYKKYPGQRLSLSVRKMPLFYAVGTWHAH